MNDCITCGRAIRLASMRASINRKRGMSHWLEPREGGTCICLKDFCWTKWLSDKSRPTITEKKIAEWNVQNPTSASLQDRGAQ
jgi:hypothetical protein